MGDLERQGLAAPTDQYGAIESNPKKASNAPSEKLPLLLGQWEVAPETLYKYGLYAYVGWFLLHRIADLAYIANVDARFPEGLGHLYPSDAQRLESVSYTRQVLMCGMVHRCVVFVAVFLCIFFNLFAKFDSGLRSFLSGIAAWWETSLLRTWCCAPIYRGCGCCCAPVGRCFGFLFAPCLRVKEHAWNGRLATDLTARFGFPRSFRELLLGAFYLSLVGAVFFALSAPFMYWMQSIDLKFGFANALNVSLSNFRANFIAGLISTAFFGIPSKFLFLAVLQYRLGWVFMWAGLIISVFYAQHNVEMIAPMLGMNTEFPTSNFAVGRGFPLVETANKAAPWISLNRVFFPDKYAEALHAANIKTFYTRDKSKGSLALAHRPSGQWSISGTAWFDPQASVYAESIGTGAASQQLIDGLKEQSWDIGGHGTRMGVRSGKELRDKLFGFARDRRIGIGDIYMVDGSHKDARGNAFVTGAGNHSIIGLYDTLFLGQRGSDAKEDGGDDEVDELAEGKSLIQHASEVVQDVDIEQPEDKRAPRNSAQTAAMNDDEIVAILAHELAHSALKHMEMGMSAQVATSFMTFATLGWMASSPLAAVALGLSGPILHVGACAYDHVLGPPLEGIMKLFTDGLTRHNEYEADAYAALISQKYGTGLQTALAKLTVNSNQDPNPPFFFEALHSDHPPFARRWAHIQAVMEKKYGKKPQ